MSMNHATPKCKLSPTVRVIKTDESASVPSSCVIVVSQTLATHFVRLVSSAFNCARVFHLREQTFHNLSFTEN